jgi:hypothetical protein
MQESTSAHKANFSVAAIQEVFGEKLIIHVLWPRFPHLNLCSYFLFVGTLKDGVYVRKSAFTAVLSMQHLKKTCQYFKKRAQSYIGYTVRKSGSSSIKTVKLNFTGNMSLNRWRIQASYAVIPLELLQCSGPKQTETDNAHKM